RDRVRRRFLELREVARAREAEEASISTIHGFCARLLRGAALRAGLDPRFTVADQEEADRLARRAFDDALERVLDEGGSRWLAAPPDELPRPGELPEALQLPGRYSDALKSPAAERYREALDALRGACLDRELVTVYDRLRALHAAFRDRYAERKEARSLLDFADLELEALALLEGDPALRAAHRTRFPH